MKVLCRTIKYQFYNRVSNMSNNKTKRSTNSSEEFSSTSCTSSSVSSDEEVDARDLKPIKDYLSNRRELARQLFKSVKPEKIRMMLPQVLKKMDLNELEEWCASELSGMSKSRILCILNGKLMLESSDTSESDDSGPSLEIISDTEEWLTDDDDNIKKEQGISRKAKTKKQKNVYKEKLQNYDKKDDAGKIKLKSKANHKEAIYRKHTNVEVKEEDVKETSKEKEADSLLDLLELEMRARAIRALIRKEDDIIPNSKESKTSATTKSGDQNQYQNSIQDDVNAKESCRQQLEKIISSKQGTGDEEDVVLVVQPTPTIELLSSESENEENRTRINKKLDDECISENQNGNNLKEKINDANSIMIDRKNKGKTEESSIEKQNSVINEPTNCTLIMSDVIKSRKGKKKAHVKDHNQPDKSLEVDVEDKKQDITFTKKAKEKIDNIKTEEEVVSKVEKESLCTVIQSRGNMPFLEEDKLGDQEEVIDLDNYSDEIEDMENYDHKNKNTNNLDQYKNQVELDLEIQKSKSTETWVTRYYQTDDVQNVIKESKIQSEIRKRLRERQRLSKLNNSLNSNSSSKSIISQSIVDKSGQKPTGSVKEYLALKQVSLSNSNNSCNSEVDSEISTHEKDKSTDTCINTTISSIEIPTVSQNETNKSTVVHKQEDT